MNGENGEDDTVEIPILREQVLAEKEKTVAENEQTPDELKALSRPERTWLKWFYSLSAEDKKVVEICGEKGVSVTRANFDQMKAIVKDHYTADSGGPTE
jgi:hypothetical protein